RTVRSTTETSAVGTLKAIPVNLPSREGITLVTALAAPVDAGIMFNKALLPPLQSFLDGPSTVICVAVVACTVVINASSIPKLSFYSLSIGARQFVVQDALETILSDVFTSLWFTPITNMGALLEGAEITTFLAPPSICDCAVSKVVKIPVHSATISAPTSSHFKFLGSLSAVILTVLPFTSKWPSFTFTVPSNFPCTESYSNK